MDNKPALLKAFIADTNAYQKGKIAGFWHSFPTTSEELQTALKERSFADVNFNDYFIERYELCLDGFYRQLREGGDIDEINFLAVKLEKMSPPRLILDSILEVNPSFQSLTDIINAVENIDKYDLQPVFNTQQYGELLIDELKEDNSEAFMRLQQSENIDDKNLAEYIEKLECNVNVKKLAKERENVENGFYTSNGYLKQNGELSFPYLSVKDIPEEYHIFTYPEKAATKKPEKISVLDKLADAKAESAKNEKTDKAEKSNETEL